MNLACQKWLGNFTKVLGNGVTPPSPFGKNSQKIPFFFLKTPLSAILSWDGFTRFLVLFWLQSFAQTFTILLRFFADIYSKIGTSGAAKAECNWCSSLNNQKPTANPFTIVQTSSHQNLHNALCVFGKRGPKMFNFELLFLQGFSSKNCEILNKAVLTPQEYNDYFFLEKRSEKNAKKTCWGCLFKSRLVSKNPSHKKNFF